MKRKILLTIAVAAAGMLLLTACTSSDKSGKNTAENKSGTGTSSDTLAGINAQQNATGVQSQNTDQQAGDSQDAQDTAGTQSNAGSQSEAAQAPVQPGEPDEEGPIGDEIPDEDAQAAEVENQMAPAGDADDLWTGTYVGDEETVTITQTSDTQLQFAFAQSGISGTAELNGYQAVYKGDDYYVVVFNLNDTVVDVSVSSEEDFDASGSPLIGSYVRAE